MTTTINGTINGNGIDTKHSESHTYLRPLLHWAQKGVPPPTGQIIKGTYS